MKFNILLSFIFRQSSVQQVFRCTKKKIKATWKKKLFKKNVVLIFFIIITIDMQNMQTSFFNSSPFAV